MEVLSPTERSETGQKDQDTLGGDVRGRGRSGVLRTIGMHPAAARTLAADLLEYLPGAYCSVMRRRHPEWFLVDDRTDIVIEGYQSCGNTFARKAMEHANPGLRIASHSHSWANVARGLRLGKPVVVLLRPPLEAVASHAVRMRLADLDRELRRYRRFHRRAVAAGDAVVLAPFPVTVDRFGEVIEAVNTRYGTAFEPFDHHDPGAKAEVLSTPSELDRMWRIARPNAERKEATREMQARLTAPPFGAALARCQAVHDRLIEMSTLSA
jgi:hypothetical protein